MTKEAPKKRSASEIGTAPEITSPQYDGMMGLTPLNHSGEELGQCVKDMGRMIPGALQCEDVTFMPPLVYDHFKNNSLKQTTSYISENSNGPGPKRTPKMFPLLKPLL